MKTAPSTRLGRRRCLGLLAGSLLSTPALARAADDRVVWPAIRLVDGTTRPPEWWRGRPAIVVVWATWCPFCKVHNAHVEKLHRSVDTNGPRILGICIDGTPAFVAGVMRERGWTFPTTVDADGTLRAVFTDRRVVPLTCLVDRAGVIRQRIPGEMFEEDVLALARFG